jgi:glycosyltransferase involved in cell wall biosynthesis
VLPPFRLSVLLVSHNHERYVQQALRSLFGQTAEGPIEIVVADDASTDRTLAIVREFEGTDSRFSFVYLQSTQRLGITANYRRGFEASKGKYVAILEGDDYWTSPYKLERQTAFLDAHWECALCSVNYLVYDEAHCAFAPRLPIGTGYRLLGPRDLIFDNVVGNFSTCVYRRETLARLPAALFETPSYDWIVNICAARDGPIGFLEEPMSVYRVHSGGAWSGFSSVAKMKSQLARIPEYNAITDGAFEIEFRILARHLRKALWKAHLAGPLRRLRAWLEGLVRRPLR